VPDEKDWSTLSVQSFYLDQPLYDLVPRNETTKPKLLEILEADITIDAYCDGCGRHSVFRSEEGKLERQMPQFVAGMGAFERPPFGWVNRRFRCQRDRVHTITVYMLETQHGVQKVGQLPSVADLQAPDLQKYRKILGKERFGELSRAVGLAAHGIGIGAFVYLRRIFESLVEEAHVVAKSDAHWNEGAYVKSRMAERIALLKAHLPPFLFENVNLWTILSLGVHELTEEDCLKHLAAVRIGIEIILDQQLAKQAMIEKTKKASQEIQQAHQALGSTAGNNS